MRSRCGTYQRWTRLSSDGQPTVLRRNIPIVVSKSGQHSAAAAGGSKVLSVAAALCGMPHITAFCRLGPPRLGPKKALSPREGVGCRGRIMAQQSAEQIIPLDFAEAFADAV